MTSGFDHILSWIVIWTKTWFLFTICLCPKRKQNVPMTNVLVTEWPAAKTGCPPSVRHPTVSQKKRYMYCIPDECHYIMLMYCQMRVNFFSSLRSSNCSAAKHLVPVCHHAEPAERTQATTYIVNIATDLCLRSMLLTLWAFWSFTLVFSGLLRCLLFWKCWPIFHLILTSAMYQ